MRTFGLDIGTTSIKAALLRKEGEGFILDSITVAPAPPKGILSESLADHQAIANEIKEMLQSAQIRIPDVVLSLPENQVYTKIIEMPQLSEQELSAALKFEMEQYIPLPLDQVRTDWQIMERRETGGKQVMDVMIVAAPIVVLAKYEKVLALATLNPQAIESEIISVHRALFPILNTQTNNIIIHIGSSTTSIAVIKNGLINMAFSIGVGGLAITRAISVDLGIDLSQAENFKKVYGLSNDAFEGKIGKALTPILDSITGDLKKAMLLFKEKNSSIINQVVLSGGTALLPGIDVYFTNALSTQVAISNVWKVYGISNVPEQVMLDAPSYNVVIGLALRGLV